MLCDVERQESRAVLFEAAGSHMEITQWNDGVVELVSFFLKGRAYATCHIWTYQLCRFGQRAESWAEDPELGSLHLESRERREKGEEKALTELLQKGVLQRGTLD